MTRAELNAVVARLANGERETARSVFDALWPLTRAFCAKALGETTSEDAAQRTLVRFFEQVSAFDPERDATAWCLEIALWECRTELRRRLRSREELSATDVRVDERANPELALSREQEQQQLRSAIASLSAGDRQTLEALLSEKHPTGATWRKRKERALGRLKLVWRTLNGND